MKIQIIEDGSFSFSIRALALIEKELTKSFNPPVKTVREVVFLQTRSKNWWPWSSQQEIDPQSSTELASTATPVVLAFLGEWAQWKKGILRIPVNIEYRAKVDYEHVREEHGVLLHPSVCSFPESTERIKERHTLALELTVLSRAQLNAVGEAKGLRPKYVVCLTGMAKAGSGDQVCLGTSEDVAEVKDKFPHLYGSPTA